jgi:hypothetical protein
MRDRQQIEELWRRRLADAKLRLDFARQYLNEVQRDQRDGTVPAADGNFAYRNALRAENYALAEYSRILRTFTHLVVGGKTLVEAASGHERHVTSSAQRGWQ